MKNDKEKPLAMQRIWLWLLPLVVVLAACGGVAPEARDRPATRDDPLLVVATTAHLADTVQQVGGDLVTVEALMGSGIDPHTYVPTESDLRTLSNADVIFYHGLFLEAQLADILEQIGTSGAATVVATSEQLDPDTLIVFEPDAGEPYDPHVWNDVGLWQQVVTNIGATLGEVDSTNAPQYAAQATAYAAQLAQLDENLRAAIETVPPANRTLVTAHDAFNYLGRAYGLEVYAIQGISTAAEAGASDIAELVDLVVAQQVPAIFVESTISPRTIEAVQTAAADRGHSVQIGGELYSDAPGAPGSGADTYIGMMQHNINTIVAALGGAPLAESTNQ